jgi:hypothetical protein
MRGAVFAPFHYGFDPEQLHHEPAEGGLSTQANELTMTIWDPVSKQPYFKTAACRVSKVRGGDGPSTAPTTAASAPASVTAVPPTRGGQPTSSRVIPSPDYPNDPAGTTPPASPADMSGRS